MRYLLLALMLVTLNASAQYCDTTCSHDYGLNTDNCRTECY